MRSNLSYIFSFMFICLLINQNLYASGSMSDNEINNVSRTNVSNKNDRERLSKAAALLSNYEIEDKKTTRHARCKWVEFRNNTK